MPPQSAILLITGGGYTELPCPTLSVIITVTKKIFKTLSLSLSLSALKLILRVLDTRVEIFFIDLMTDSCSLLRVWQSCFDDLENLDVS